MRDFLLQLITEDKIPEFIPNEFSLFASKQNIIKELNYIIDNDISKRNILRLAYIFCYYNLNLHENSQAIAARYILHSIPEIDNKSRLVIVELIECLNLLRHVKKDLNTNIKFIRNILVRVNIDLLINVSNSNIATIYNWYSKNKKYENCYNLSKYNELINAISHLENPSDYRFQLIKEIVYDNFEQLKILNSVELEYSILELARQKLLKNNFDFKYLKFPNKRPEIIIPIGPPGSGKSTTIQKMLLKEPDILVISSDEQRKILYGDEKIQGDNKLIFRKCDELLLEGLKSGRKIYYDATNTNAKLRQKLVKKCLDFGSKADYHVYDLSKEELKKRNASRTRQVPESVIDKQCNYFSWPEPWEYHIMKVKY